MPNRFEVGQARLNQHLQTSAGVAIIYHRLRDGVDTAIPLIVSLGATFFKVDDREGQRSQWSERDYLIPVVSLVVDGVLFQPAKGDWIAEAMPLPHGVQHYEISAPNDEPAWRWSDAQHTLYRVHCKRVSNT